MYRGRLGSWCGSWQPCERAERERGLVCELYVYQDTVVVREGLGLGLHGRARGSEAVVRIGTIFRSHTTNSVSTATLLLPLSLSLCKTFYLPTLLTTTHERAHTRMVVFFAMSMAINGNCQCGFPHRASTTLPTRTAHRAEQTLRLFWSLRARSGGETRAERVGVPRPQTPTNTRACVQ